MSERQANGERPRFIISDEDVISDPSTWPVYKHERVTAVKAGEQLWMIKSIHGREASDDMGLVYDFYSDGGLRGYIEWNESEGYYTYRPAVEDEDGPQLLNIDEPIETLEAAKARLEDYITKTYHPSEPV